MTFIQEKLSDIGTVSFVEIQHETRSGIDSRNTLAYTASNIVADQSQCRINWHLHGNVNGTEFGGDLHIVLHDVQDIEVKSFK